MQFASVQVPAQQCTSTAECVSNTGWQTEEGRSSISYKGIKHRFAGEVLTFSRGNLGTSILLLHVVRITPARRRKFQCSELNEADKNGMVKHRRQEMSKTFLPCLVQSACALPQGAQAHLWCLVLRNLMKATKSRKVSANFILAEGD